MIGLYLKKLVLSTASFSGHKVQYKGDFPVVFACVPDTIARSAHTDMCCKITPAILCSAFYWTYFYMTINLQKTRQIRYKLKRSAAHKGGTVR